VRFRSIVEVQYAVVALAGAHEVEISVRQQLGGGERDGHQQLLGRIRRETLLESHFARAILDEHGLLPTLCEERVQRREIETLMRLTSTHELSHYLA